MNESVYRPRRENFGMPSITPAFVTAFSDLVEKIYDAAWVPSMWAEIPPMIAALHESPMVMLFAVRRPGVEDGFVFPFGISAKTLQIWAAVASKDIWVSNGIAKGLFQSGKVVRGEELVSDQEFLVSDYYNRFLKPADSRYLLSGVLFDGQSENLPTSVCSVMRGHSERTFGPKNVQLHRLITNHLSKSMATMWRLRSRDMETASTYSALDHLPTPIVLLDHRGSVAFCNRGALSLLARNEGVSLRRTSSAGDRIAFVDTALQRQFDAQLRTLVSGDLNAHSNHILTGLRVARSSGALDYVIQIAPLSLRNGLGPGPSEHRAIAFIYDPAESSHLDRSVLTGLYELTPAEIRVAEALAVGEDLLQIAERLKVRRSTVRTHLASLFRKTRTKRQAELMKLLLTIRTGA